MTNATTPAAMADQVFAAMQAFVRRAVQPLVERVQAVEARPAPRDGVDGKDADPELIRAEVAKAVAAIPRPKDGESVHPDTVALMVRDAVEKATAALPKPQNGRDALEIAPLVGIDPAKAYPAGTWAKHAGGLWLARRCTDGMDGWDCIVNGVAGLDIEPAADLRTLAVRLTCSDGTVTIKQAAVPTVIYRGIWRAEELYTQGDSVTRDGSTWVAMSAPVAAPGEESSGWVLSVKRGRDGRDGVRGEKGDRGAEGRAGKDLTQVDPQTGAKW